MSERRGPIIKHDGKGYPRAIVKQARDAGVRHIIQWKEGSGRFETPWEQANPGKIDSKHPGWTWKRKLFGGWRASDDQYARIVRYQFIYPGEEQAEKSEQVEMLKAIAKGEIEPAKEDA